ncbi:hypothetical protein Rhe02_98730 [Rhizocola hellebori]|uniref:Uncharacterized protein n=1 Tax=Rhizocola hellebori TaxID=1392758 RepID=A0A8J3QJN2_9ACTN|nr:hypothetical protein [Rhizocola hellebori]GIH11806.1 hypothetical protein Rhe02_98730 [Rhizocola hellebori]
MSAPQVSGKAADRLSMAFYAGVAVIALAGQITAAERLELSMLLAIPGMALLELGGVALAARADYRRRLGENAYAARVLSGGVALFAVLFNWFGHQPNVFAAGVFAFMSALGYLVWLINSGDKRRDQLRAEGKLTATPPVYGWAQWLKRPALTRRARALALADPTLGVHGSLSAAANAVRAEARQKAIAAALRAKLAKAADPTSAAIAVATYDLDTIAAKLAAEADYDGLTALIAAEMTPVLLTASADAVATRKAKTAELAARADASRPAKASTVANGGKGISTADRVAKLAAKTPEASPAQLAAKLGLSERTVQRYLPKATSEASSTVADVADSSVLAGAAA